MKFQFIPKVLAIFILAASVYAQGLPKNIFQVNNTVGEKGEAYLEQIACEELTPHSEDFSKAIFTDDSIKCGFIYVPENHDDPNSTMIKLASYFIPSTSSMPKPDPIIYLEGGPGGAGFSSIPDFANGNASFLRERSDIIIVDQRGAGYSQPSLICYETIETENEEEAVAKCHERLLAEGVGLEFYNSYQNALDIQDVRKAYGYQEVNLYGISYGTRLALTIMRDAPEGIRTVVLDSTFPPQVNGLSEDSYVSFYVLNKILKICERDAQCNANYPNLASDLAKGILRVNNSAIGDVNANAYIHILRDSFTDPSTASLITSVANDSDEDLEEMFGGIDSGDEEGGAAVLTQLPKELWPELAPAIMDQSEGMYLSVVCQEEYPFMKVRAMSDNSTRWKDIRDVILAVSKEDSTPEECIVWDVPPASIREIFAVRSPIPTLVLAGEGDVATPPAWSKLAAQGLVNSQYVEFPMLGHGVLGMDECVNNTVSQFLDKPLQKVDSGCISAMPTIAFE